ncbi:WhiB family transcriptional regulator [Streptomyces prunicolor]|uniref:WhiB family transcriptional regulator n=1 Tax=Streptomyces prunicolor TaxID=67348 RepID=UPI003719F36D
MSTDTCPPLRPHDEPVGSLGSVGSVGSVGWQTAAACAGLPPKAVFSKKVKEAAPVLRACARCPVRRDCERIVAPTDNWFDGVCGGRLYRSGRPVEIPAHLLPEALTTLPTLPALSALPVLSTRPGTHAPRGGSLA